MYPTVPITIPGTVPEAVAADESSCERASVSFARPKSRIFTQPSRDTMTFSGLRSRWTMPEACAFARPSAICAPISRIFFVGSGSGGNA